jgi:hypothetical protein
MIEWSFNIDLHRIVRLFSSLRRNALERHPRLVSDYKIWVPHVPSSDNTPGYLLGKGHAGRIARGA